VLVWKKDINYFLSTNLYANKEHYVSCNNLPSVEVVQNIMIDHKTEFLELVRIGSDMIPVNRMETTVADENTNSTFSYVGS
jgi:hypothetical protein